MDGGEAVITLDKTSSGLSIQKQQPKQLAWFAGFLI
jgi:hypothetical protein